MEELGSDWINLLFTKNDASRGDCPIGVSYHKRAKKYEAKCSINGKQTRLGYYNTIEEAFNAYKQAKENEIKKPPASMLAVFFESMVTSLTTVFLFTARRW